MLPDHLGTTNWSVTSYPFPVCRSHCHTIINRIGKWEVTAHGHVSGFIGVGLCICLCASVSALPGQKVFHPRLWPDLPQTLWPNKLSRLLPSCLSPFQLQTPASYTQKKPNIPLVDNVSIWPSKIFCYLLSICFSLSQFASSIKWCTILLITQSLHHSFYPSVIYSLY